MVSIHKNTIKQFYVCDVCGSFESTKRKAEECERKQPEKIKVYSTQKQNERTNDWEVGNLVLLEIHDDVKSFRFGIITGQGIDKHDIIPDVEMIDGPAPIRYDSWNHRITLLDKESLKKIVHWADLIIDQKLI